MRKADIPKVYTAEDVLRRLTGLQQDVKAIKTMNNGLTKTEDKLRIFVETVIKDVDTIKNQEDRNVTTWFFSGLPTFETEPEENWTEEEKPKHIDDLYYDKETGYAYRYILENGVYLWKEVTIDEARVLSLANGELDTGDNKRRVFVGEPITPYETGDIWLNNGVFYRCRATRNEGLFESVDWCTSSEYKDDYYLKNIEAVLNQFIRTVTTDYATRVSLETTKDSINANVSSITTKITNDYQEIVGKINVYDEKVEQQIHDMSTKLTDTEFKITSINKTLENGITKVETETGYTFGSDGLKIGNSESIVNNTLDENGMSIATGIENVLFAGYDKETQETIVKSKNMTVEKYLVIPSSRFESYENPTFGEATGAFSIDN